MKVARTAEQSTISLHAGSLRVTQTIARDAFEVQLAVGKDVVRFTAGRTGQVSVQRGGTSHSFSMRTSGARVQAALAATLTGSVAVHSFDALMRSEWGRSARAAGAFRSGHSMLWLLQGDNGPVRAWAASIGTTRVSLALVRDGADACWSSYSNTLQELYSELESCLDTWNPLQTAWCAYTFNFHATLAMTDLLDCYI